MRSASDEVVVIELVPPAELTLLSSHSVESRLSSLIPRLGSVAVELISEFKSDGLNNAAAPSVVPAPLLLDAVRETLECVE